MSLQLIIGCMYSGKSSELIRQTKRLQTIHKSYIIYNSHFDKRYGSNNICTHDQFSIQCQVSENLLPEISTQGFINSVYIFIEEAQFFTDLYEFVKLSVDTYNKHVIVFGLDGDSDRNNFGQIHQLIPLADDITKLKALCNICNDGTLGIFSKKINTQIDAQIDVGSINKYIAVCRKCYLK